MLRRYFPILFIITAGLLAVCNKAEAQQTPADTVVQVIEDPKGLVGTPEFRQMNISAAQAASLPDPRKSAFLSTILPGMGQVYNGALWKVPIIYAGGSVFVAVVNFNNQRYSESLKNLMLVQFEPELAQANRLQTETFYQRATDYYRRQRDYFIIVGTVFYALQIVEAYVDAHLQTFDLDDELSLRIRPTLIPDPTGTIAGGLRITYTLP